jgi:hypothetical protein
MLYLAEMLYLYRPDWVVLFYKAIRALNLQSMLHPIPLDGWAQPHVKTTHDAAVTFLGPRYNLNSGPSSAAGAWNVDGSPFRLSLSVRENNNQTDAHFEVIPN